MFHLIIQYNIKYLLCQWLKEFSNYNKCSQTERMSPITSHGECWLWRDAFVYMFKLNFNSHNSTKPDIPRLISHLNICHQSVTAVISGNQCNSGQLKCDCEGGTSLYSIMGNKTAACFLSRKKKCSSLFFCLSLYWIFDTKKKQREEGIKTLRLSTPKSLNCQGK